MSNYELFFVIFAALVIANILNETVFNPLMHKFVTVLYGNLHNASRRHQGSAKKDKSLA